MVPEAGVLFGDEAEGVTLDFKNLGGLSNFVRNDVLPRFARFFA